MNKLKNLVNATIAYREYTENTNLLRDTKRLVLKNMVLDSCKEVINALRSRNEQDIAKIFNSNIKNLYKIYDTTVGQFAKLYRSDDITFFRPCVDTLFQKTFKVSNAATRFNMLPTAIFTEFCKGITYFQKDIINERPIYHRENSCGSKSINYKSKFSLATRDALKKCYIERLIYNAIFENILHYQDSSHKRELRNIERLYQDYFPKEQIILTVDFINITDPVNVTIYTRVDGRPYSEEQYNKSNSGLVNCVKFIKRFEVYTKTQEFTKEQKWEVKRGLTV